MPPEETEVSWWGPVVLLAPSMLPEETELELLRRVVYPAQPRHENSRTARAIRLEVDRRGQRQLA
jgi:hypothetical protein